MMKHKKYLLIGLSCLLSFKLMAGSYHSKTLAPVKEDKTWSFTASLGYTEYQNAFENDGKAALGRFAIGSKLFAIDQVHYGLEVGIQNGNQMRLNVPQATLDVLGGLPIQSTIKPMVDVLLTLKSDPFGKSNVFAHLKAGAVYRTWQFENRSTIADKNKVDPELQLGLGYQINPHTSMHLSYERIFGKNPDFTINADNETASIKAIPKQEGILLGITYLL